MASTDKNVAFIIKNVHLLSSNIVKPTVVNDYLAGYGSVKPG